MVRWLNLTPHAIDIVNGDTVVTIPVGGPAVRVDVKSEAVGRDRDLGFKLCKSSYAGIVGLPPMQDGVQIIVSKMVADAAHRADLWYPGDLVRDDQGRVVGCAFLTQTA